MKFWLQLRTPGLGTLWQHTSLLVGLLVTSVVSIFISTLTVLFLNSSAVPVDHFSSKEEICQTKLYLCHFALNTSLVPFHFFRPKTWRKFSFNVILYKLYTKPSIQIFLNIKYLGGNISVVLKLLYLRSELSQSQANNSHRNVINKGNVWFLANSVCRILSLFLDKENLARDPNQKS